MGVDTFSAIVVVGIAVVFVTFLVLGRLADNRKVADITDKRRNRALGAQAEVEDQDLPQMVDAANEYRRRQGRPETTVEEVRTQVGEEQAALLDEANREVGRRGGRGRASRERRGF